MNTFIFLGFVIVFVLMNRQIWATYPLGILKFRRATHRARDSFGLMLFGWIIPFFTAKSILMDYYGITSEEFLRRLSDVVFKDDTQSNLLSLTVILALLYLLFYDYFILRPYRLRNAVPNNPIKVEKVSKRTLNTILLSSITFISVTIGESFFNDVLYKPLKYFICAHFHLLCD